MAWGSVSSDKGYFAGNSQTKAITVTTGDLIVVSLHQYEVNLATTAISDTAGNTYTKRYEATGGDGALAIQVFDAKATTTGTITVTINPGGTTTYCSYCIAWRSGAHASSWFDKYDTNSATSVNQSGGPITPAETGEWLLGHYTDQDGSNRTITPDADYTQLQEYEDGATYMHMSVISRDYNSTSADTANWTISASVQGIGGIIAYKKAADTVFSDVPATINRKNQHLFVR